MRSARRSTARCCEVSQQHALRALLDRLPQRGAVRIASTKLSMCRPSSRRQRGVEAVPRLHGEDDFTTFSLRSYIV